MYNNSIGIQNIVLPKKLQELVSAVCRHFQVHEKMVIPVALGLLASVAQDKFKVEVIDPNTAASYEEPLSLFCIGIAESGERKSPVMKCLKQPILEIASKLNYGISMEIFEQESRRSINRSERASLCKKIHSYSEDSVEHEIIASEIASLDIMFGMEPKIDTLDFFLQNTTGIAAADFMNKHHRSVAIVDAEGGSFDSIIDDHSLFTLLLSGFSNEEISFYRRSSPSIYIPSPHATVCVLTQYAKLKRLAKKPDTWFEGFIPRGLIFNIPSMAGMRHPGLGEAISKELLNYWQQACENIITYSDTCECFEAGKYYVPKLSKAASEVWLRFSADIERMMQLGSETVVLKPWLGKMAGVAARIACLFHLYENEVPYEFDISANHMQYACSLIYALIHDMFYVHNLYFPANDKANNAIYKIVNWLYQEAGTIEAFKLRDMYRELNIGRDLAFMACSFLVSQGVLRQQITNDKPKPGRHGTPVYFVNYYNLNCCYPLQQYRYGLV